MVSFVFYSPDELLVQSAWSDGFSVLRTLLGLHSDYTYILFVLQGANVQNAQLRILPTPWNIDAAERSLRQGKN